jgi:hypothetical protein
MRYFTITLSVLFILLIQKTFAQDDLLSLVDDPSKPAPKQYVIATWKTGRLGNMQTTEPVKKKHLEYRILHRFGNITDNTKTLNQLGHTAFGFDAPTDIRMALDYGIIDNLSVGLGRSRINEMVDISIKYRILRQTEKFKIPVTITLFESIGYTTMSTSRLYADVRIKNFKTREAHRLNYFTQLLIASKLNDYISLQIAPAWLHRNFIVQRFHPETGEEDANDYFILAVGGRVKFTQRITMFFDYFHQTHKYLNKNPNYFNPLSVGFEVETGGHIFTLYFANNAALGENNFLVINTESWSKGQFKFGFSISRTFSFQKK